MFPHEPGEPAAWDKMLEKAIERDVKIAKIACSFDADTPILTAVSGFLRIADIKPGDLVTSRSEDGGSDISKPVFNVVSEGHVERVIVTLKSASGITETLTTTLEHPFHVADRGWVVAQDMKAGDQVHAAGNAMLSVVSVRVKREPLLAYNF